LYIEIKYLYSFVYGGVFIYTSNTGFERSDPFSIYAIIGKAY